jgi:hypothetical protein
MTPTRICALFTIVFALSVAGCGGGDGDGATNSITSPGTPTGPYLSVAHCKTELDNMRATENPGAPVLAIACGDYVTYAQNAVDNLIVTGVAHGYFDSVPRPACAGAANAENQGISTDPVDDSAIDAMFALFLAEKNLPVPPGHPSRGHYDAIINPTFTQVAIAIRRSVDGRIYLTMDFGN